MPNSQIINVTVNTITKIVSVNISIGLSGEESIDNLKDDINAYLSEVASSNRKQYLSTLYELLSKIKEKL